MFRTVRVETLVWVTTSWRAAWWTAPAPFSALVGTLLPHERAQEPVGLLVGAAVSFLLAAVALRRAGRTWSPTSTAATLVALVATVLVALALSTGRTDGEVVLGCTALGLPHVALAGLAWPGLPGLALRVAVATAAVLPASLPAAWLGLALLSVPEWGPAGLVAAFVLGHVLVLTAGTCVAPPVTARARQAVPA